MSTLSEKAWVNRWVPALLSVVAACMGCVMAGWCLKIYREGQAELAARPPYYGVWALDDFTVTGPAGCSLYTEKIRTRLHLEPEVEPWRRLIIEEPKTLVIQTAGDAFARVNVELDAKNGRASLSDALDKTWKADLVLEGSGAALSGIEGTVNGCQVKARARRVGARQFQLSTRGFHFINERPF